MRKNCFILTMVLVLILSVSATASAPRGFIGDTGSGWDTSGTVSARVGHQHPARTATDTINGSGIDPNDGQNFPSRNSHSPGRLLRQ